MKFSIITPTYKRHKSLKRCINSVLKQTHKNFEMLICSDGHDPLVKDLIDEYSDSRIRYLYVNEINDIGTTPRNYSIKYCSGDYIIYLDDDNILYENCLEILENNLSEDISMVVFRTYNCLVNGIIPVDNVIRHANIDSLSVTIKRDIVLKNKWQNIYEHDFLFIKDCESTILNEGLKIKYIENLLGEHLLALENEMSICVISSCKNEEKMLPFYLDYYLNYVGANKIVLYDGNSIDDTIEIAKKCSSVELIIQDHEKYDERNLMLVRNEEWKKYRKDYDWMIVCDLDEFLYHPNLRNKLKEYKEQGITIPLVEGFDMMNEYFPIFEKGTYLPNIIKNGIKDDNWLNKNIIFNPRELDINYTVGGHGCRPEGNVKFSDDYEFKLLHYKWLSYEYVTKKSKLFYNRISDYCLLNNFGIHTKDISEMKYEDFEKKLSYCKKII